MKKIFAPLGRLLAILLAGILIGFAMLVAVYALPVEPMAENLRLSVPSLSGEWGSGEDSYEQLAEGYRGTQLDNSTDAAMLLAAVYDGDEPLITRSMEARRYTGGGYPYSMLLRYPDADPQLLESAPTARYWHGYLVLLKPLLCVFTYMDIRMLLAIAQGAMLLGVVAGMCRRRVCAMAPAFALSLLCVTPWATSYSLQFSTALMTGLAAMLALLYVPGRRFEGRGLYVLFLIVGMATSYFDYLTYPVFTFGMPFVLSRFLYPADSVRGELRRFAACGLCWALGYFGMWAAKWALALAFTNEQWFLANLQAKIEQRSDASLGYWGVLKEVLSVFAKRAYLFVGAIVALAYGGALLRAKKRGLAIERPTAARVLVLALTALIPFAWYLCTQNHSYNHAFFTSRSLAVSVFAVLSAAPRPSAPQNKDC